MASVVALAVFTAALAIAGIALHAEFSRRIAFRERVLARIEYATRTGALQTPTLQPKRSTAVAWVEDRFEKAGLKLERWHVVLFPVVTVMLAGSAALARGTLSAAATLLAIALGLAAFLSWRTRRRREMILEQLPSFLDHVVRAVNTGSSLPNALADAAEEIEDPIRGVFARVVRQAQLGIPLEEALEQAAEHYALRELRVLALTVGVSQRYGGSVREVLASIVTMIRQRDRTRREFKAMTGETRLSAIILGSLPALIAIYVMIVNPDYINRMLNDDVGRNALYVAASLQATGCLVLWRMVRSV